MAATAHILNLFFNDPLTKAILPVAPTPGTPSKEFSNIQSKLTALENTVASLAKAGKTPTPPSQLAPPNQANAPLLKKGATVTQPTYAAKATAPPRASVVVSAAAYRWSEGVRPSPA